jgi:hypothetical protein
MPLIIFSGLLLLACASAAWSASAAVMTPPEAVAEATESADPDGDTQSEQRRFRLLPIPIIITEPAIGEGLGAALALFHPVKEGKADTPRIGTPGSMMGVPNRRDAPPVVTAIAAAYTNNDTWFAGIVHANNWRSDSIRYVGAGAAARVNSQIYLANRPLRFSMDTALVYQDVKFRLGQSDFLLGGGLSWLDAETQFRFDLPGAPPEAGLTSDFQNVGISATLLYETRDSSMSPTAGQLAALELWRYEDSLGGDFDYWAWNAKALSFHPLTGKLTLGLRLQISGIDGDPPFFAYPYVKLRGIPALRYQDRIAGALEAETRYRIAPRWEASLFAGLGYTSDDVPLFRNPGSIYNYGVGGRYLVFEAHKVWMGIDIARGPEEWNWYIQVGHPW